MTTRSFRLFGILPRSLQSCYNDEFACSSEGNLLPNMPSYLLRLNLHSARIQCKARLQANPCKNTGETEDLFQVINTEQ